MNNYSIGGYFELELKKSNDLHDYAVFVNSGRNALEYIIRVNNFKKIYVPYYTCDSVLEPIRKLKISYEFYFINELLEPIFNFKNLEKDFAFLYTNYFGLKSKYIEKLSLKTKNLIVDNAHAYFDLPLKNVNTFYSPRKFFGVPDGGIAYTTINEKIILEKDISIGRLKHLLERIEFGAEMGYNSFLENEKSIEGYPLKIMSSLTRKILQSVDVKFCIERRRENFLFLYNNLKKENDFHFDYDEESIPFTYPFMIRKKGLREFLISKKIYTPFYWANVLDTCEKNTFEYDLAEYTTFLPIDQRYTIKDMNYIIKEIKKFL